MAERWIKQRLFQPIAVMAFILASSVLTACGDEDQIGLYTDNNGIFTVEADENLWEMSEMDGDLQLRLKTAPSVWISFSAVDGISRESIQAFQTEFADSYVETLRESYPDVRKVKERTVNEQMAGLDVVMTDITGQYEMYQMLYLVTDGSEGYLITSTLSKEEEAFQPEVEAVIESFQFIETTESP